MTSLHTTNKYSPCPTIIVNLEQTGSWGDKIGPGILTAILLLTVGGVLASTMYDQYMANVDVTFSESGITELAPQCLRVDLGSELMALDLQISGVERDPISGAMYLVSNYEVIAWRPEEGLQRWPVPNYDLEDLVLVPEDTARNTSAR